MEFFTSTLALAVYILIFIVVVAFAARFIQRKVSDQDWLTKFFKKLKGLCKREKWETTLPSNSNLLFKNVTVVTFA